MQNKTLLTFFVILIFSQTIFAGGGWPQPKGHGFFKLSQWWLIADQHFTDQGRIDPNQTTGLFNTSIYAEYGFTDRLTGVLYAPLFSRAYFNNQVSATTGEITMPGEAINGIGDTDLGIKYGLTLNKPVAVSATLTFGLPLGNDSGGTQGNLQLGDGEFNQILQVDAGTGFKLGNLSAYANTYLGINNRTKNENDFEFSDELRFGVEAGVTFGKDRLTVIGRLFGVESFKNGDSVADQAGSSNSVFANNAEHLSFAPEIAYNLNDKWGVSAGIGVALRGELIAAAPSYTVGVYYRLTN